ncbi:MAG: hypothetical protein EPN33_15210 [Acidobacteria bacterium]|nr:MAG: hypothetical protein EPN33_15210 [Acidobacteriota bacterium]
MGQSGTRWIWRQFNYGIYPDHVTSQAPSAASPRGPLPAPGSPLRRGLHCPAFALPRSRPRRPAPRSGRPRPP